MTHAVRRYDAWFSRIVAVSITIGVFAFPALAEESKAPPKRDPAAVYLPKQESARTPSWYTDPAALKPETKYAKKEAKRGNAVIVPKGSPGPDSANVFMRRSSHW